MRVDLAPRLLAAGLATAAFLQEAVAHACPACAGAQSGSARGAYLASTAVLSLLPLGLIATGAWLLRRAGRRAERNAGRISRRFQSEADPGDASSA